MLRIVALVLAIISTLSFASCGNKDQSGGEIISQGTESKGNNEGDKSANTDNSSGDEYKTSDAKFTQDYYNWLFSNSYLGFYSSMEKTTLPEAVSKPLESLTENKKLSFLKNIFFPLDFIAIVQSISEFENRASKYTHEVVSVKRNTRGIYLVTMKFVASGVESQKSYEVHLCEDNRAIKITTYDGDANALSFHEIVLTPDGNMAVNRATAKEGKWSVIQLFYKADGSEAGYCNVTENMDEEPKSIYPNSIYAGFAGKN